MEKKSTLLGTGSGLSMLLNDGLKSYICMQIYQIKSHSAFTNTRFLNVCCQTTKLPDEKFSFSSCLFLCLNFNLFLKLVRFPILPSYIVGWVVFMECCKQEINRNACYFSFEMKYLCSSCVLFYILYFMITFIVPLFPPTRVLIGILNLVVTSCYNNF